ncbi:MAG: DUF2723 domain-containing protein, partial [Chloroflexi bacterium]|nr:DUF2723 domain-containing protein [Chloroflexota bacterium]
MNYPLKRNRIKAVWEWPLGGVGVVALLLVVYLLTLPPTLTWAHHGADGGDLVTAVARGSIPHPPGFPTYLLLGELFIRLPWGDPAWRLNLMSAVLAVGAVGLTAAAIRLLLRPGICNPQPATSNLQPPTSILHSPFSNLRRPQPRPGTAFL